MTEHEPELKNFWNLGEGLSYLRLSFTGDDRLKRVIAWKTFVAYWAWPLVTVCILEVFWHSFFHFVVGW